MKPLYPFPQIFSTFGGSMDYVATIDRCDIWFDSANDSMVYDREYLVVWGPLDRDCVWLTVDEATTGMSNVPDTAALYIQAYHNLRS